MRKYARKCWREWSKAVDAMAVAVSTAAIFVAHDYGVEAAHPSGAGSGSRTRHPRGLSIPFVEGRSVSFRRALC